MGGTASALGNVLVSPYCFYPPRPSYYTEDDPRLTWVESGSGTMIPIYHNDRGCEYTVIYSHGNAEDLGFIIPYLDQIAEAMDSNIVGYDYTGYGPNPSGATPSEHKVYGDIAATWTYATETLGIPPDRIILYGRSLGGGPTCQAAVDHLDCAGVVLESTFTSCVRTQVNWSVTPIDVFENIHKVPKFTCPVLVIHGREDEVIPFSHGERLAELAQNAVEPFFVDNAGHNDLVHVAADAYYATLREFSDIVKTTELSTQVDGTDAGEEAVSSSWFSGSSRN